MIKIEAKTLPEAMEEASRHFDCSVTQLKIEVIQHPKAGILGLFQKPAIIVAVKKNEFVQAPKSTQTEVQAKKTEPKRAPAQAEREKSTETAPEKFEKTAVKRVKKKPQKSDEKGFVSSRSDIIAPTSLVTAQDDYESYFDDEEAFDYSSSKNDSDFKSKSEVLEHIAKHEKEETEIKRVKRERFDNGVVDDFFESRLSIEEMAAEIETHLNRLFSKACFEIEPVKVSVYEEHTVLVEFSGKDAALLIGKEGYRYKALSYMIFNWINAKYGLQLRLEIAEFLKNQEEMVHKYLEGICTQVVHEGRAQTKILDGVLVQIALKHLRLTFPDKYVAIRTNRDGLKYIIINSFRSHANH